MNYLSYNIRSMIKQFLLDILFPQFCLGCQKEGSFLCSECFEKIPVYSGFFCPVCGKRDFRPRKHPACAGKTSLKTLISATSYENLLVRDLIHNYKYNFIQTLAEPLSQILIKSINATVGEKARTYFFTNTIIIPIPLHSKRLNWRGFNQAELIAQKLSEFYKIPLVNNALIRVKNTIPQVEAGEAEKRRKNIKEAFVCLKPDKKILLVDDVSSTGATLEEAAQVLKQSGAKEIWGIVVAK